MRRHPSTWWRTGDFARKRGADAVYRVDGAMATYSGVTLVPCCSRGTYDVAQVYELHRAIEEDIPTDAREAAILALECDGDGPSTGAECLVAPAAWLLSRQAYAAVSEATMGMFLTAEVRSLNAAALLRDGWNPGDPVEVLP